MGCDIHLHIEVRLKGRSGWEHYAALRPSRNYAAFGALAGVRCPENNLNVHFAGLPEDLSCITQHSRELWDGDGHDHAWLDQEGIKAFYAWWQEYYQDNDDHYPFFPERWIGAFLFGNGFDDTEGMEGDGVADVRWIYWFDN